MPNGADGESEGRSLVSLLRSVFNVRSGEGRTMGLMLVHSFFLGVVVTFFETASNALFLSSYSSKDLPRAYVLGAVVTGLTGLLYTRLERRLSPGPLMVLNLSFVAVSVVVLRVFLVSPARWPALALMVWSQCVPVLLGMEFWGLATSLFDVRQSKRLFGILGSGEVVAGILGGLLVPWLVARVGTQNLLWFAAVGVIACVGLLLVILRSHRLSEDSDDEERGGNEPEESPWGNRYVWGIVGMSCVAIIAFYQVEFSYLSTVEERFPNADQLAGFLGKLSAIAGGVTLVFRLLASGRLLNRFGLLLGLTMAPVSVGLMTLLTTGGEVFGAARLVFIAIVATKVIDDVLRSSMLEPSIKILYQPLPTAQRVRVLSGIEGIVEPVASGLAGLLLALMTEVLTLPGSTIRRLLFVQIFAWVAVAIWVQRRYVTELTKALSKPTTRVAVMELNDQLSSTILLRGLGSNNENKVLRSLRMMEEGTHVSLPEAQRQLLHHESARVRREALESVVRTGAGATMRELVATIMTDQSPEVRTAAIRALCALNTPEAIEHARLYLDSADTSLRGGALVGLLHSGGIVGVLAAGQTLTALEQSTRAKERRLAAEVLGEVSISSFYQPLLSLLADPDPGVRKAAVRSTVRVNNPRLFPLVIQNLTDPQTRIDASSALVQIGDSTLPALTTAFSHAKTRPRLLQSVVRIVSRMKTDAATSWLTDRIDYPDEDVRAALLFGLARRHFYAPPRLRPMVEAEIRNEATDATWTLITKQEIALDSSTQTLARALEREIEQNVERLFFLLSFLYERDVVMRARENHRGASPSLRAYALEVLDNVLSREHKALFFPLLDDMPDAQRRHRLEAIFPAEPASRSQRLLALVARPRRWAGPWVRACAAQVIGHMMLRDGTDALMASVSSPDDVVRETALWALSRLMPPTLPELLQRAESDPSPRVATVARTLSRTVVAGTSRWSRALVGASRDETRIFAGILLDPHEPPKRRTRAASALRHGDPEIALDALLRALDLPDEAIRAAALSSLLKGQFMLSEAAIAQVTRLLDVELEDARRTAAILAALGPLVPGKPVLAALAEELRLNRERVIDCLTALGSQASHEALRYHLASSPPRPPSPAADAVLAQALAIIEPPLRDRCHALLTCVDPTELLTRLDPGADALAPDADALLGELLYASASWVRAWTRVCALDLLLARDSGAAAHIERCLHDPDPLVREVARSARPLAS